MRFLDYLYESEGYEIADSTPSGEQAYIEKTEKELFDAWLHKAVDSLIPRQKEMVIMVYFQGKSQDEVAEHYGINQSDLRYTTGTQNSILSENLCYIVRTLL